MSERCELCGVVGCRVDWHPTFVVTASKRIAELETQLAEVTKERDRLEEHIAGGLALCECRFGEEVDPIIECAYHAAHRAHYERIEEERDALKAELEKLRRNDNA